MAKRPYFCVSTGSFLPPQVSHPAGERLPGLSDERAQRHQRQHPLSTWGGGRQRPPMAQYSTDSGEKTEHVVP